MEIIIGSVCVSFVASLLIVKSILRDAIRDFMAGIEKLNKDASIERAELTKLIKAESLTDFEMNRPVPVQRVKEPTPEEIKAMREFNLVGTIDDEDLRGQVQYS